MPQFIGLLDHCCFAVWSAVGALAAASCARCNTTIVDLYSIDLPPRLHLASAEALIRMGIR